MHKQIYLPQKESVKATALFWFTGLLMFFVLVGCESQDNQSLPTTTTESTIQLSDLDVTTGQTVYVPAYSEIYYASRGRTIDLTVTLAVHNTDFEHAIVITSVRYYDSRGELLKEYLSEPVQLGPLASADFFVEASEQSEGVGTNFVVEWVAEEPVFEPIVEAIMLNTSNNQGVSLTSPGRVISQIAPPGN